MEHGFSAGFFPGIFWAVIVLGRNGLFQLGNLFLTSVQGSVLCTQL